jgi:uncharacterized protein
LNKTPSIPMGSIDLVKMYPLDFEEFLLANSFNEFAIQTLKGKFENRESLEETSHAKMMGLFKKYLLIGGLPDAVNAYLSSKNIVEVRKIQEDIHEYYGDDAGKYDREHKLKIKRIYSLIPSRMECKNKKDGHQGHREIRKAKNARTIKKSSTI